MINIIIVIICIFTSDQCIFLFFLLLPHSTTHTVCPHCVLSATVKKTKKLLLNSMRTHTLGFESQENNVLCVCTGYYIVFSLQTFQWRCVVTCA